MNRDRSNRLVKWNVFPIGAVLWTIAAVALLCGPDRWIEWFWFARGWRELGRPLGCVILCGAWYLVLRGVLKSRSAEFPQLEERSFSLFHLLWFVPLLVVILWFLRDQTRTTGDATLFTWALGLGQLLRVPHAPLTQTLLNHAGRGLAYSLNLSVPDGVALCVVIVAGAFVAFWLWMLAPLPWHKRWPFLWLLSASSLLVLAFGQVEIYLLPVVLEALYLFSIWVYIHTGRRWWLPGALFPFLLLAGMWHVVFLPLHAAVLVRQWKTHPDKHGGILSWIYLAVGIVVLFFGINPRLAEDMWTTLFVRLTSHDYIRSLSFVSKQDSFTLNNALGLLNVILGIVIPAVPLMGLIENWSATEPIPSRLERWFPWLSVGLTLPLAVVWNPWFGYERDVDLYSFVGPPLILLIGAKLSACEWKPINRQAWLGLFLLGLIPTAGTVLYNSQIVESGTWREPAIRLSAWLSPDRVSFKPREALLAGHPVDAIDWINALDRWMPQSRPTLLELVDARNINQFSTPETLATNADKGWARDMVFWAQPKTVLIVDCWGRLFSHDGRELHDIQLQYVMPTPPTPVVALARGQGAEIGVLCRDGTVIHGHQPLDEPLGAWTWRMVDAPAGIKDAWPMDRAVDLAFDGVRDRIVILDALGGLHVAGGETLAQHAQPDFDEAVKLVSLERGWAYVTKRGGGVGIIGRGLERPIEMNAPDRWPPPVFIDAYVARNGEGRVMLDFNGILHPIARCWLYQPFFPDDRLGRFCSMAIDPETNETALLDRLYQVTWVMPDVDGVIVLHQLLGANQESAKATLEQARWAWEHHATIRERMIEVIRDNPDVLSVAKQDLFWGVLLPSQ